MRILVAGLINLEVNVPVEGFPLPYTPVRYSRVAAAPSGVGWNLALALHTLGSEVRFLSFAGADPAGEVVRSTVAASGLPAPLHPTPETPAAVILTGPDGRRRIEADLKKAAGEVFPEESFDAALSSCDLALLSNVEWTRPLLGRAAAAGIPIATDLHAVASLENPYDADYLEHADVLFLSGEHLPEPPEEFAARVLERSPASIVGIGLGANGALVASRGEPPVRIPAAAPRPATSTVGAGDALLAGFCHFRGVGHGPEAAMRRAVVFAGWKVGEAGGAAGFLTADAVEALLARLG
jgi:sugar/nucleoside kinase (ribokinase family)